MCKKKIHIMNRFQMKHGRYLLILRKIFKTGLLGLYSYFLTNFSFSSTKIIFLKNLYAKSKYVLCLMSYIRRGGGAVS